MNIPTLTAARFTLRAFREDDVPALTALHSDPEVMRFLRPNGEPEPIRALLGSTWQFKWGTGC